MTESNSKSEEEIAREIKEIFSYVKVGKIEILKVHFITRTNANNIIFSNGKFTILFRAQTVMKMS